MNKLLGIALVLVFGFIVFVPQGAQAAARHKRGSVVVDKNRVVYYLGESVRYPFPSMEVFKSWGHTSRAVVKANDGDLAMPVGPVVSRKFSVRGHVDQITADGYVRGWMMYPEPAADGLLYVEAQFDKTSVSPVDPAFGFGSPGQPRLDVNTVTGVSGEFGFEFYIPEEFRDGQTHTVLVYGLNPDLNADTGNKYSVLPGSGISFNVDERDKVKIDYFESDLPVVESGKIVRLSWSTINAISATINDSPVSLYGSKDYIITEDTTFQLDAYNSGGRDTWYIEVRVMAAAQVRDEKRFEDILSIIFGLYGYSVQNANKFPDSLQSIVPTYLNSVPTPVAGAQQPCSGPNNEYVYTPSADRTNFTFRFCFETDMSDQFDPEGNLGKPGVHTLDYKQQTAQAESSAADAIRSAEIRQLMTALELFYNDNNRYPASANGVPSPSDGGTHNFYTYISNWPTAPTPPGGSCTSTQNTYTYSQVNAGQSYSLTFCLGTASGGSSAGAHKASPDGIQ